MLRLPPRSPPTDTRFPYPALYRSRGAARGGGAGEPGVLRCEPSLEVVRNVGGVAPTYSRTGCRPCAGRRGRRSGQRPRRDQCTDPRSEEHTSELQSLMRIRSAVFWWKNKKYTLSDKTLLDTE